MQLIIQNGSEAGKKITLNNSSLILGREASCDVQIPSGQISRRHLEIANRGGTIMATDLGSANGSYLNEQRLTPMMQQPLKAGDTLRLGDITLVAQEEPVLVGVATEVAMPVYQAASTQVASYAVPQPAYVPPAPVYQNYQQPDTYQYQAPKNNKGLMIGIIAGSVVVVIAIVVIILLVALPKNNPNPTQVASGTPAVTATDNPQTTAPATGRTTTTPAGTTAATTPRATTTAPAKTTTPRATTTPAATTKPSNSGGKTLSSGGASLTYPADWGAELDNSVSPPAIIGSSSDERAYAGLVPVENPSGDVQQRADSFLKIYKKNHPDLKVLDGPVQLKDGSIAYAFQYSRDNVLLREIVIAVSQEKDNTAYCVIMGAESEVFETYQDTLNSIYNTLQIG